MEATLRSEVILKGEHVQFKRSASRQGKSAQERTQRLKSLNKVDSEHRSSARRGVLEDSVSPTLAPTLYMASDP